MAGQGRPADRRAPRERRRHGRAEAAEPGDRSRCLPEPDHVDRGRGDPVRLRREPPAAGGRQGRRGALRDLQHVPAVAAGTSTVDLTSALAASIHATGLTGLSVAYSTQVGMGVTESVDALLLDLTYTAPAFRGETTASVPGNCLAAAYTGGSAGQ